MKKRLLNVVEFTPWIYKIWFIYLRTHILFYKYLVMGLLPIAILLYPITLKCLDIKVRMLENGMYPIKKGQVLFSVKNWQNDIMQRYYLLMDDFHDMHILPVISSMFVKSGDIIVDVGANVGNHSVYWATRTEVERVYSIEPTPSTYEVLVNNVAANCLNNKIVTFNVGCGSVSSCASIEYDSNNSGENRILSDDAGEIRVVRLDDLDIRRCDFIKIDTEGMEYDVLVGARNIIEKNRPILLIEIHDERFEKVNSLLESMKYKVLNVDILNNTHDYIYIMAE